MAVNDLQKRKDTRSPTTTDWAGYMQSIYTIHSNVWGSNGTNEEKGTKDNAMEPAAWTTLEVGEWRRRGAMGRAGVPQGSHWGK